MHGRLTTPQRRGGGDTDVLSRHRSAALSNGRVAATMVPTRLPMAAGNRATTALVSRIRDDRAAPTALEAQVSGSGINVALYIPPELEGENRGEFQRQAVQWAKNHSAIGVGRDGVRYKAAVPIVNGAPQDSLSSVMAAVRAELGLAESTTVPLHNLAIFTHGTRRSLQTGSRRPRGDGAGSGRIWSNVNQLRALLDIVASAMTAHGNVVFYACSAAGPAEPVAGQEYANLVHQSYAYLEQQGSQAQVWGHSTAGHTTGNPELASSGAGGRRVLFTEFALRTMGQRLALPTPHDSTRLAETDSGRRCIDRLEEVWQRCLRPRGNQAAMFTLNEEIPLVGYELMHRTLTGESGPEAALDAFADYSATDRGRFVEAVELVRGRLAAAESEIASAVRTARAELGLPGPEGGPIVDGAAGDVAGSAGQSPTEVPEEAGQQQGTAAAPVAGVGSAGAGVATTAAPPGASVQPEPVSARALARARRWYRRHPLSSDQLRGMQRLIGVPEAAEPNAAFIGGVIAYQRANGLAADGMVGPATLSAAGLIEPGQAPTQDPPGSASESEARSESAGTSPADAVPSATAADVPGAASADVATESATGPTFTGRGRPQPGQTLGGHAIQRDGRRLVVRIDGRRFKLSRYGGHWGLQYGGAQAGGAQFTQAIDSVARFYESRGGPGDRYRALGARSMQMPVGHEGRASAINSYDSQILTIGTGFAGGRLNAWLRSLDGTAAGERLGAISYLTGLRFNRDEAVRLDVVALNEIASVIEDPALALSVCEAQVHEYVRASALNQRRLQTGSSGERQRRLAEHLGVADEVAEELAGHPSGVQLLGVATYLHHGMPAYTPDPVLDVRRALVAHPGSPSAQVAHVCKLHVQRIWDRGRHSSGLAERTIVARIPNKLRLFVEQSGTALNGAQMASVAPCMTGVELTPTSTGEPPTSAVYLRRDRQNFSFGAPASL